MAYMECASIILPVISTCENPRLKALITKTTFTITDFTVVSNLSSCVYIFVVGKFFLRFWTKN